MTFFFALEGIAAEGTVVPRPEQGLRSGAFGLDAKAWVAMGYYSQHGL